MTTPVKPVLEPTAQAFADGPGLHLVCDGPPEPIDP